MRPKDFRSKLAIILLIIGLLIFGLIVREIQIGFCKASGGIIATEMLKIYCIYK